MAASAPPARELDELGPKWSHFGLKMAFAKHCFALIVLSTTTTTFIVGSLASKYRPEAYTCRLLNSKYVDSQPWLEYPIIFAPITRGPLTVWSGTSGLPGSEFKCFAGKNGTSAILLDFANFADKLEWTYYDKHQGVTSHGISVSHRENIVYKLHLDFRQAQNYLDCNRIKKIEFADQGDAEPLDIRTSCRDCKSSTLALVNSQISELLRSKLSDHLVDGLYWHLAQLVSSQHFSGPISLNSDFN